ncbi:MAG: NAD(P)H-hydrate dehydratase [Gammaproteobacteria bacterium]|nr:NAD(P)H-hydrate dehydratase [Gammaproteobacteria bacterium]MDH5651023.1 NAD(P)H-hydrate dehydratase [Gammaproteobacteria bacterium]
MSQLPPNLYRAAQVRELDRRAIEEQHIPGLALMERAGAATFQAALERLPNARNWLVICGTGNNGGDGYIVARLAHEAGKNVLVYQAGDAARLRGDALAAAQCLSATDVPVVDTCPDLSRFDLIIDALLGTGLQGEVSDHYRTVIDQVNATGLPVVAVDIPSGLQADTGAVLGAAIKAQLTVTFIGMKQGLLTADGPEYCGEIRFADLGVPAAVYEALTPSARILRYAALQHLLKRRRRNTHKGESGHVLLVGGDSGYSGAVILAGEAALRVGAGLVSVATRESHAALITTQRPELMCHGIEDSAHLADLLGKADVVAIGPGLGRSAWAESLLAAVPATDLPLVVDADALNLLSQRHQHRDNWILTPHPGEAGRLLGTDSKQVQQDRFAACTALQSEYGGIVVLKGAGSLVCGGSDTMGVCIHGNPGMAVGGMGDVLTGVIAGLLAQGLGPADAAKLGVCLHSLAADDAVQHGGERGLLAGDLMAPLRRRVNE